MDTNQPLLTTEEVAERLGVKPATVYAYVSRGLLRSHRNADGKGSLFARSDVDTFAAGRRRDTTPRIQTGITLIRDGSLFYRGRDATVLAATTTFEAVASLLWTGELDETPFPINSELVKLAERVTEHLPPTARLTDHLRVTVAAAASADPLRFDTTPAAVAATGRQLLTTMVHALPAQNSVVHLNAPLVDALWARLTRERPTRSGIQALNAALILLADHDIAASTLAARVAASTRAHPYAVVSAGLAALDGPLHGAASALAYPLVAQAVDTADPLGVVSDHLRSGGTIPGFGHPLYAGGDPRATALLRMIGGPAADTANRLADAVRTRSGVLPNVDLALAALAVRYAMPAHAGEAIFAVARTAGWLAHAMEEYADRPLRFRPSGRYAGESPT
ncbi:citrate synthase family protein [Actinoplanes sp. DH11]|uniref:citrate synthase family protein n=1 Tax=Actinoplanes sp. DH11 TaxID=2857011 RepID=UPI001E413257|nr:citrate synthase family protein [Actinoplanes sp. DH11]